MGKGVLETTSHITRIHNQVGMSPALQSEDIQIGNHTVTTHQHKGDRGDQQDRKIVIPVPDGAVIDFDLLFAYVNQELEKHMTAKGLSKGGAVISLALIEPEKRKVTGANLGDSRTTVFAHLLQTHMVGCLQLTSDDTPSRPAERDRITALRGIIDARGCLFNGQSRLAVSASVGDPDFGKYLRRTPQKFTCIVPETLNGEEIEFMVAVESDGSHGSDTEAHRAHLVHQTAQQSGHFDHKKIATAFNEYIAHYDYDRAERYLATLTSEERQVLETTAPEQYYKLPEKLFNVAEKVMKIKKDNFTCILSTMTPGTSSHLIAVVDDHEPLGEEIADKTKELLEKGIAQQLAPSPAQ